MSAAPHTARMICVQRTRPSWTAAERWVLGGGGNEDLLPAYHSVCKVFGSTQSATVGFCCRLLCAQGAFTTCPVRCVVVWLQVLVWYGPRSPAAERAHTLSVAKQYACQLEERYNGSAHPVQVRAQTPHKRQPCTKRALLAGYFQIRCHALPCACCVRLLMYWLPAACCVCTHRWLCPRWKVVLSPRSSHSTSLAGMPGLAPASWTFTLRSCAPSVCELRHK